MKSVETRGHSNVVLWAVRFICLSNVQFHIFHRVECPLRVAD